MSFIAYVSNAITPANMAITPVIAYMVPIGILPFSSPLKLFSIIANMLIRIAIDSTAALRLSLSSINDKATTQPARSAIATVIAMISPLTLFAPFNP